jgi:dihydropyrimidinase
MFEGFQVTGNVNTVFSRGEVVIENNTFRGRAGAGQFIRRSARGGAWN